MKKNAVVYLYGAVAGLLIAGLLSGCCGHKEKVWHLYDAAPDVTYVTVMETKSTETGTKVPSDQILELESGMKVVPIVRSSDRISGIVEIRMIDIIEQEGAAETIVSGLNPGEFIVLSSTWPLEDGMKVTIVDKLGKK